MNITNAIFDSENYCGVYRKDLLQADKNIIISSPVISGAKVYELISLLRDKQLAGVEITIVTWEPDSYGFGDVAFGCNYMKKCASWVFI